VEDEEDWDQAGLTGLLWPNGLAGRLQPSHRQFAKAMATPKPVPQVKGQGAPDGSKQSEEASASGSEEGFLAKGIYDPDTGKPIIKKVKTNCDRVRRRIQQPSTSSERVGQAEEFERQLARFPDLAQLREDIRRHYTARLDSMRSLGTFEEIVQLGAEYAEVMRALRTVSAVILPEDFEDGAGSDTLSTTTPTTVGFDSTSSSEVNDDDFVR